MTQNHLLPMVGSTQSCLRIYCSERWKNIKVIYTGGTKMFSESSFLETSPNPTGVSSEKNKILASKIAAWDQAYTSNSGSENAGFLK